MMRRVLMAAVRGYRLLLSPWIGGDCRFEPTCSVYSLEALERHGAAAGTYLTLRRIARCQPWCQGGGDPVPEAPPRFFAWASARCETSVLPSVPPSEKKSS